MNEKIYIAYYYGRCSYIICHPSTANDALDRIDSVMMMMIIALQTSHASTRRSFFPASLSRLKLVKVVGKDGNPRSGEDYSTSDYIKTQFFAPCGWESNAPHTWLEWRQGLKGCWHFFRMQSDTRKFNFFILISVPTSSSSSLSGFGCQRHCV